MRAIPVGLLAFTLVPRVASAQPTKDMPGMSGAAAKTCMGVGIITAIDPKTATVTISDGSIPGIGWPAMTMTFKATPPALLKNGVEVEDALTLAEGTEIWWRRLLFSRRGADRLSAN